MKPEEYFKPDARPEFKPDFSQSMGVNTRPAHQIQIGEYWVLVDPNMPKEMLDRLKMAIEIHSVSATPNL